MKLDVDEKELLESPSRCTVIRGLSAWNLDVQLAFQKEAKGQVTGLVMDRTGRPQRTSKKLK